MATLAIVHGAFGGGWEWTDVARRLRARGHEAFTPTLTGMGDRSHLGSEVGLGTHVEDVVALLEYEDLHGVVLCGASGGGMAVKGAADRAAGRVALLVYIDALVPRNGESALDLLPRGFGEAVRASADARGHGLVAIPEAVLPPAGGIPERDRARYIARLRQQPVRSLTEPVRLTGSVDRIPRAFVRCTASNLDVGGGPIEPMAARARTAGWAYRELAAPHDPHLFDPAGTAAVLEELAAAHGLARAPGPRRRGAVRRAPARPIPGREDAAMPMSPESRRMAGVLLVILPAVVIGGFSILTLLVHDPDYIANPIRQDLWRAGHAHAGVLLVFSLLALRYVDEAALTAGAKRFVRVSIPVAAILLPVAFFLSVLRPDATEPNALVYLAYAGGAFVIAGVLTLGVGLIRTRDER